MASLFDPVAVADLSLANRMVMAPLTRSRAGQGNVPTALMATYYSQRATAGLVITEATQVCPQGQGYICGARGVSHPQGGLPNLTGLPVQ